MAWNRSNNGDAESFPRQKRDKPSALSRKGLFVCAALALALAAGLAVWMALAPGEAEERAPAKSKRPQETVATNSPRVPLKEKPQAVKPATAPMPPPSAATNSLDTSLPDLGALPEPPKPIHRSVFKSSTDQVISMLVNSSGEVPPLPYTSTMDQEFRESLKQKIVIEADDSPEVVRVKEAVIAARAAIKEMLDSGMSVKEILEEHRKDMNFAAETRRKIMREAQELFDAGDVQGARDLTVKMNAAFSQMGIDQIDMPMSKEERRAQRRQAIVDRANSAE